MAIISFPYDSQLVEGKYDRAIKSATYRQLLSKYFTTGVFPNPSTQCQVYPSTGMKVSVRKGSANINGLYVELEEDVEATIERAGSQVRYDRVILRHDDNNDVRATSVVVLKGVAGGKAPTLTRNETVYDICLATITVKPGTISISSSDIEDTRLEPTLCGIVSATIKSIDTSTFYNQIKSDLQEFKENEQTSFQEWFENIKSILGEDVAGNLLNLINEKSKVVDGQGNLMLVAPMTPNQNLLTNADFRSGIINQKQKSSYTTSGSEYTIDMWESIVSQKVDVFDGYIKLTNTQQESSYWVQQNGIESKCKAGIPLTIYVNVKSITGKSWVYFHQDDKDKQFNLKEGENVFVYMPNKDVTQIGIGLTQSSSIEIYQMKLEKGYSFTGMPAWDEATELNKCLYYYERIYLAHWSWFTTAYCVTGNNSSSFPIYYKTKVSKPSIILPSGIKVLFYTTWYDCVCYSASDVTLNTTRIPFTYPNEAPRNNGTSCPICSTSSNAYIDIDSNKY